MKLNIIPSLEKNYMPYTAYVILQRALPEIDGLKPSQRRILYTMYKMGLQKGNRKKSQGVVGQTMFLHAHGDMSIYETLVRMSRDNGALLNPYVDSKGNFGKHSSRDMQFASARYTEVRLESLTQEFFKDINNNTVDFVNNYDGTMKEPRLLPVTFPSILTNAQSGTAVGMSCSIPSFNLNEVVDYTIALLKNKNAKPEDYIKAPDFPTGGNIIYDEQTFKDIFSTGKGSFKIRSKYEVKDDSIVFYDIPYTTTYEAVIDKITSLVKESKLKDIVDVDDITGINSDGIEVTVKKNTDKELLTEKLFKLTTLEDSFSCNMNIIVDGKPTVMGLKEIVVSWIRFRAESVKRGMQYDVDKKESRRHLLEALKKVLLDIDKAVEIIRHTKKNKDVVKNLMKEFSIDEEQAEFVADIKLRHLNEEYIIDKTADIESLTGEIDELKEIIEDKMLLAQHIIEELKEVKENYGKERRTDLISKDEIVSVSTDEVEIQDYNVKVYVTKDGYIKKVPLTSLRGNYEIKTKDDDEIVSETETRNNSEVLIFTDARNVYKYKTYELADSKASDLGDYLPQLLELDDEEIVNVHVTDDYEGFLIVGFDNGKVSKVNLSAYETKQNRSMLKNAYGNGSKALFVKATKDDLDLIAVSSIDKAILFNTSMINAKASRTSQGNTVMRSKNDSVVDRYVEFNGDEELEYYRTKNAGVGKYLKHRV